MTKLIEDKYGLETDKIQRGKKWSNQNIKVYMTGNFLSPGWKDLLKLYNNFFCSFSFSFF